MILSAAMLVEHVGENAKAERIWQAVRDVVKEGKARTYDMLRLTGSAKVVGQGAATTTQMTDAILRKIESADKAVAGR
jgi:3-isopropylmalate dehydrogenase